MELLSFLGKNPASKTGGLGWYYTAVEGNLLTALTG